jgi:hypothetical protein
VNQSWLIVDVTDDSIDHPIFLLFVGAQLKNVGAENLEKGS